MYRMLSALSVGLLTALPVSASDFVRVDDLDHFLTLVEGRELRLPLYGVRLRLSPQGDIRGDALGWDITGAWRWEDGYFCREMDWGGAAIPMNCQMVEVRGDRDLRFTVDRGAGESATFRLR